MSKTPDIPVGARSSSTWANEIRDRTIQVFDDIGQRDNEWAVAPDGAACRTLNDDKSWERRSGAWVESPLQGIQGIDGQATIIIGIFGDTRVPADLPVDGQFPANWDGPGRPATPMAAGFGHSLIFQPADELDPQYGHLFQYVGANADPTGWADIGMVQGPKGDQGIQGNTGPTGPIGPVGPQGIQGDDGVPGQATTIIGYFGIVRTPIDLPLDGYIPVGWDGPGHPGVAHQMAPGESLVYSPTPPTVDPDAGHLFAYAVPGYPLGWVNVGLVQGPPGLGVPTGGGVGVPLIKRTGVNYETEWASGPTINPTTAEMTFPDGSGVTLGGARVYKLTTGGLMLRESSGGQQPQIEDNNGANRRDVLDALNHNSTGDPHTQYVRKSTAPNWTGIALAAGVSGSAAYRVGETTVSFRFSVNRAGAAVGNVRIVAALPTDAMPNYPTYFTGQNKEAAQAQFLASGGVVDIVSGGASQDVFGTAVWPRR